MDSSERRFPPPKKKTPAPSELLRGTDPDEAELVRVRQSRTQGADRPKEPSGRGQKEEKRAPFARSASARMGRSRSSLRWLPRWSALRLLGTNHCLAWSRPGRRLIGSKPC
ncbi:hypothetical protein Rs2_29035 [Raphanus sativus]|nr:hypothetical protein Rs2_29035 [Raphanus sativus]